MQLTEHKAIKTYKVWSENLHAFLTSAIGEG
jgi:hypothetical protein